MKYSSLLSEARFLLGVFKRCGYNRFKTANRL